MFPPLRRDITWPKQFNNASVAPKKTTTRLRVPPLLHPKEQKPLRERVQEVDLPNLVLVLAPPVEVAELAEEEAKLLAKVMVVDVRSFRFANFAR